MKKIHRKILLPILVILLSIISLGTVTYAWFAMGNTSTIDQFQIQAVAEKGIEISVTDGAPNATTPWVSNISGADFIDVISTKYNKTGYQKLALASLTTEDNKKFYGFSNGAYSSTEVLDSTGKYLSININFRSRQNGYIDWNKAILSSTASSFNTTVTGWNLLDGTLTDAPTVTSHYLHHALRIGMTALTPGSTHVVVYEDFDQGVVDASNIPSNGNYVLGDGTSLASSTGSNGAHSYFNATRNASLDLNGVETIHTSNVNITPQTITNLIAGENGYFIGTVQLNIWVEGWDQNAIDAVLEAFVNVSLGFTLVTP